MSRAFQTGDIMLPAKDIDRKKWSVIACDQFTSEPEYWEKVEDLVGKAPSTLSLMLPEVYLEAEDHEIRLTAIHEQMRKYLEAGYFDTYKDAMFYIERTDSQGQLRQGLVGCIDLEEYDYSKKSTAKVRATEATVPGRLPPRVHIRENAALELPHVMVLIDDEKKSVIEPLADSVNALTRLYDFDLMLGGGHLKGYLLGDREKTMVADALDRLEDPEAFAKRYHVEGRAPLIYAIGDGNHSLASAKLFYEQMKKANPGKDLSSHPARYALVEVVNLHSPSLAFEAIHRIVVDVDPDDLMEQMTRDLELTEDGQGQSFYILKNGRRRKCYIGRPTSKLTVGSLQRFLDAYTALVGGRIDYIHGEDVVENLSRDEHSLGFLLPVMEKKELFPTVIYDGALPRKTFSMGHAEDKRYYTECRLIEELKTE